ncbi:DUF3182 family protein [Orrella sp. JC864]|uniref:DUF3182 family protein n=1 Tax=Orrella sp. JC864 TaxID=3120298 RepID=UPI003008C7AC
MSPECKAPHPAIVVHPRASAPEHERATQQHWAGMLAGLLAGAGPAGPPGAARPRYLVPCETLVGAALARQLGIQDLHDLFGGLVPHAFVATKAVSHALVGPRARAPAGWSHALGPALADVVLRGYTAFDRDEARQAGRQLLAHGALRLKPADGVGGRGQVVIESAQALEQALQACDERACQAGLVLEENLQEVTTYSVGIVHVGGQTAAYVGTQSLTPDNRGEQVYGGSLLRVAHGGFDRLRELDLAPQERRAIELAMRYDAQALACYPDIVASRRNYDVALGRDAQGRVRMGVLEQSWRAGGASVAELAALRAFRDDPGLRWVLAGTQERYGEDPEALPDGFVIVYEGLDPTVGRLRKSGGVIEHGYA